MNASEVSLRFSRPAPGGFAPYHPWDRNFFLLYMALICFGIGMGFGPQIAQHLRSHAPPYPLIIHLHAAVFVGWVILLMAQVLLIRRGRPDLHRKLGLFGAGLAGAMIIIGPITAVIVHRLAFGKPGANPAFLAVQLTDILAFAGLITTALLWRRNAVLHKRLVLLATLYISDAGFARWLSAPLQAHLHLALTAVGPVFVLLYLGNDLLVVGIGAYDWITRHRLHPAYVAGVAWTIALQLTGASLLLNPGWQPIALKLIGH